MGTKHKNVLLLPIAALALSACGGSDQSYDDVATGVSGLVSDGQGGDAQLFADAILALRGTVPIGLDFSSNTHVAGDRGALTVELDLGANGSVSWKAKGKIDTLKYKFELERRAQWTITGLEGEVVHINGTSDAEVQSELKDHATDEKRKYHLDYNADYRDIDVRSSDHVVIGGELELRLKVKATESDSFEKIKQELDVKARVTFDADGNAMIDLDEKYKYKLSIKSGELELQ